MAEDKVEPREINWRQLMPWTTLFQGFRVALDPNKLILAAFGILFMAFGWWLLAVIFDYKRPDPNHYVGSFNDYPGNDDDEKKDNAWKKFKEDRDKWHIMHRAAGAASDPNNKDQFKDQQKEFGYDSADLTTNWKDWQDVDKLASSSEKLVPPALPGMTPVVAELGPAGAEPGPVRPVEISLPSVMTTSELHQLEESIDKLKTRDDQIRAKVWLARQQILPVAGRMRTLPWKEDRGPNQFLLITGQAGPQWKEGHFGEWLLFRQIPVLLEPLVKMFSPVVYFFNPKAGSLVRFYSLLVMLWTLLIWGFFGGAITRIAAVQVARQEKVGLIDAMRFAARKYTSYLSAPLFPLVLVGILLILMILFGYVQMIPILGDLLDLLLWGLMILIGLAMAVVLIGLVGWPLMASTISAEGTDAWEAVSRSYSYVYQAPWHYIWYTLVALAYGAVIVFFVGLMGSLTVYLSKFGVSQTPGINWRHESNKDRNPTFLFVYAPESFGWRKLLLQDDRLHLVNQGEINETEYNKYLESFSWANSVSAVIVSVIWVGIIFMLVLGFGYSYFWSAATIIYLLMRRKVDDAEIDEVYLEEEDESAYAGPLAPKPAVPAAPVAAPAAPTTGRPSLPIVEPPPRPMAVSVPPPAPPPPPPPPPVAPEVTAMPPSAPPPTEPTPPPGTDGDSPPGT